MEEEIWKDIVGYEGLYQVSNLGNVKSLQRLEKTKDGKSRIRNGRIMKFSKSQYYQLDLCKNGFITKYSVHRLVAQAFIPNPNNYPCINHKDENKLNNTVENLEWCTYSYNSRYGESPKIRAIKHSIAMKGKIPWNKGKKASLQTRIKLSESHKGQVPSNAKKVMCVETREIYNSAKEAERNVNIFSSNILYVCYGQRKTAGGYHWEFV